MPAAEAVLGVGVALTVEDVPAIEVVLVIEPALAVEFVVAFETVPVAPKPAVDTQVAPGDVVAFQK